MENVNFIFKFIPFSYIKSLLEIVVKSKIKKMLALVSINKTGRCTIYWHMQHISVLSCE